VKISTVERAPSRAPAGTRLKVELQTLGVRLGEGQAVAAIPRRCGGAGPAEGITLLLDSGPVNVSTVHPLSQRSPFLLDHDGDRFLLSDDRAPGDAREVPGVVDAPSYYAALTSEGVPFSRIARLHGNDCLASTVIQDCVYWGTQSACRFCAIGTSLRDGTTVRRKAPSALAEVAAVAASGGIRHVTLTTGSSLTGEDEIEHLAACTRAIKAAVDLPIQVQCMPARIDSLVKLHEAGVSTVGIHIETCDLDTLALVAPAKARLGWSTYVECWEHAVEVFGRWQVVTYLIAGLGERTDRLLHGVERLCDLGVYPHLVPLRPIPGSPLAGAGAPSPRVMDRLYLATAGILRSAGGSWRMIKAGCGRCSACSALSDYEDGFCGG
jgi:radical SAM protein (TIGR04043 family)